MGHSRVYFCCAFFWGVMIQDSWIRISLYTKQKKNSFTQPQFLSSDQIQKNLFHNHTSKSASFFDRPVEAEIEIFIDNNLNIVQRIYKVLDELGWTQKDLAQKLGVSEDEISDWLSGFHDLSLKQISKMEAVMGRRVLEG